MSAVPPVRWIAASAVAGILVVLLHGAWEQTATAVWIRVWIVCLMVLTTTRPDDGLLCLAGLLPIATATSGMTRAPLSLLELSVVASFLGWTIRYGAIGTKGALRGLAAPLASCTLVIISSAAVDVLGRREVLGEAEFLHYFARVVPHTYFSNNDPREILHYAGELLSGLALFAMAAVTSVRRPELVRPVLRMATAGACGAALLSLLRITTVAMASEHPAARLVEVLRTIRISVQFGDVNAAGSYFAMMFFVATGLAAGPWRRAKAGWWGVAAILAGSAWLTSSRAAVIAMILVSVALGLKGRRGPTPAGSPRPWAPLAACALAAGLFVVAFPNRLFSVGTAVALQVRLGMARISLAMLAAHPWFGIGIGRYYEASGPLLASSSLATYYLKENAHNNFLQFAAELGVVGFALMGWLFWTVGGRIWGTVKRNDDPVHRGLAAGLLAFLLTALVGHPLLTPEVSLNFWLLLGIAAGGSTAASRWAPRMTACVCVLLLATFPARVKNEIRNMDWEHVTYGFGPRGEEQNGIAYRTIKHKATFFLRSDTVSVRLPLRAEAVDSGKRAEAVIAIELDGRVVNLVTVGDEWRTTTLVTPKPPSDGRFHKVVLVKTTEEHDTPEIRIGPLEIIYQQPR